MMGTVVVKRLMLEMKFGDDPLSTLVFDKNFEAKAGAK